MVTRYPAGIDTSSTLKPIVDGQPVTGRSVEQLREAIIAIEEELGVKPSGPYGTVRFRLDTIENIVGQLRVISLDKDLGGTLQDPLVIGIQGRPVNSTAPHVGQALVWDGLAWTPRDTTNGTAIFPAFTDPSAILTIKSNSTDVEWRSNLNTVKLFGQKTIFRQDTAICNRVLGISNTESNTSTCMFFDDRTIDTTWDGQPTTYGPLIWVGRDQGDLVFEDLADFLSPVVISFNDEKTSANNLSIVSLTKDNNRFLWALAYDNTGVNLYKVDPLVTSISRGDWFKALGVNGTQSVVNLPQFAGGFALQVVFDPDHNQLFVIGSDANATTFLLKVDASTNHVSVVPTVTKQCNSMMYAAGFLWVVQSYFDSNLSQWFANVLKIDPVSNAVTTIPTIKNYLSGLSSIVYDSIDDRIFYITYDQNTNQYFLERINPNTNTADSSIFITDFTTVHGQNVNQLVYSPAENAVWVLTNFQGAGESVGYLLQFVGLSGTLANGLTIRLPEAVSSPQYSFTGNGNAYGNVVYDSLNQKLWVTDNVRHAIISIDPVTGLESFDVTGVERFSFGGVLDWIDPVIGSVGGDLIGELRNPNVNRAGGSIIDVGNAVKNSVLTLVGANPTFIGINETQFPASANEGPFIFVNRQDNHDLLRYDLTHQNSISIPLPPESVINCYDNTFLNAFGGSSGTVVGDTGKVGNHPKFYVLNMVPNYKTQADGVLSVRGYKKVGEITSKPGGSLSGLTTNFSGFNGQQLLASFSDGAPGLFYTRSDIIEFDEPLTWRPVSTINAGASAVLSNWFGSKIAVGLAGAGTIRIIDGSNSSFPVLQNISTSTPSGSAFNFMSRSAMVFYIPNNDLSNPSYTIQKFDAQTYAVTTYTFPTGRSPIAFALEYYSNNLWAITTDYEGNYDVREIIDPVNNSSTVLGSVLTFPSGTTLTAIATKFKDLSSSIMYVADSSVDKLWTWDTSNASGTLATSIGFSATAKWLPPQGGGGTSGVRAVASSQPIPSQASEPGWYVIGAFSLTNALTNATVNVVGSVSDPSLTLTVRIFNLSTVSEVANSRVTITSIPDILATSSLIASLPGNTTYQVQAEAISAFPGPGVWAVVKSVDITM